MPTLRKGLDFFFLMPWQLPMDPWILISTSCVILSLYLELHIFPTPNSSHYTLDILLLDLQFPPWFLPLRHCHLRHLPFSLVINLAPSCLYNNSRDNVTQLLSPFRTTDTMHDSMTIPRNTLFHFTPLRYCLLNDLQLFPNNNLAFSTSSVYSSKKTRWTRPRSPVTRLHPQNTPIRYSPRTRTHFPQYTSESWTNREIHHWNFNNSLLALFKTMDASQVISHFWYCCNNFFLLSLPLLKLLQIILLWICTFD
jgi:hypothetical protein